MIYYTPNFEEKLIEILLAKVLGFLISLCEGQLNWSNIGMEVKKSCMTNHVDRRNLVKRQVMANKNYPRIYIKQYRSDQIYHDYTTSLNEMVNNCKKSHEEKIQLTDLNILYTLHQINTLLLIYPFQTLS